MTKIEYLICQCYIVTSLLVCNESKIWVITHILLLADTISIRQKTDI